MIDIRRAQKYCKDDPSKIENYEKAIADSTQTWDLHHRLELTLDGEYAHSREELKRMDMYYNRPYFELIFMTASEHARLHRKGKALSDETKYKMSDAKKGMSLTNEHRLKISEAMKGRKRKPFTAEHRRKMSDAAKRRYSQQRLSEIKLPLNAR